MVHLVCSPSNFGYSILLVDLHNQSNPLAPELATSLRRHCRKNRDRDTLYEGKDSFQSSFLHYSSWRSQKSIMDPENEVDMNRDDKNGKVRTFHAQWQTKREKVGISRDSCREGDTYMKIVAGPRLKTTRTCKEMFAAEN